MAASWKNKKRVLLRYYIKAIVFFFLSVPLVNALLKKLISVATSKKYYSQFGEDIILSTLFYGKNKGFYVDIGAYNPYHLSNTAILYQKGWSGINIEPNPSFISMFETCRPRDINLQVGVSESSQTLDYYDWEKYPVFNTFCESVVADVQKMVHEPPTKKIVQTFPLGDILDKYLPEGKQIDLLSVDAEGMDLQVFQSNHWHITPFTK